MAWSDPPFSLLDEAAIATAELRRAPYDFAFVEQAVSPQFKDEVLADAPQIPNRGSYGLPSLRYGPQFGAVVEDLLSPRFRRLFEKQFDMVLSPYPPCLVMMWNTTGHYNEGYAHPDSKHKFVTVLIGYSREWPYERGRLRVLRSKGVPQTTVEGSQTHQNFLAHVGQLVELPWPSPMRRRMALASIRLRRMTRVHRGATHHLPDMSQLSLGL